MLIPRSSYTEFSAKHGRDDRFKAIEKPRDRENYFNEHIADVRKREKEEKEKKREQVSERSSTTRHDINSISYQTIPYFVYSNVRLCWLSFRDVVRFYRYRHIKNGK